MKARFTTSRVLSTATSFFLKAPFVFAIPAVMAMSLAGPCEAAAKELVYVSKVEVTKIKDGKFKVTASGDAPSAGWEVKLEPVTYIKEPDNWLINANGVRPDGASATMMTPWTDSVELGLGPVTKKVTVNGRGNKSVSADVPHDSAADGSQKDKGAGKDKGASKGKGADKNQKDSKKGK